MEDDEGVAPMPTVLLVANQTLAGGEVEAFVKSRLSAEPPPEFTLLVPATASARLSDQTARTLDSFVGATRPDRRQETADSGYEQARARLEFGLDRLRRLGATVNGDVGVAHPFTAISEVLARRRFDEVVLFTLPSSVSRWLHLDIPHHVERKFHVPVTVITAGGR